MTTVTVLGTGIMGAPMARNLASAGLDVTVWNRTVDKARGIDGATVAPVVTDAVSEADIVVTMLFDADSTAEIMASALPSMKDGAIWIQSATVGLDGVDSLSQLAAEHGVTYLDAPVLGTKQPAENGALTVLVGGPRDLEDAVAPVFDAIGAKTVWVGEQIGDGHRLKLVANSWVLSVTSATAQALATARALEIDPREFLSTIQGGPLDCGYAQLKGAAMLDGHLEASFGLDGATKDAGLIADAMESVAVESGVMRAMQERFADAAASGHGKADMAAVIHAF